MAGGRFGVAERHPRHHAAARHAVVRLGLAAEQRVHLRHDRPHRAQRKRAGDGVRALCPVAFNRVSDRVQRGGHRQPQRHAAGQLRVDQRRVRVVLLALDRALDVLLRVPDGRPAGGLAARARRGRHADPARLRLVVQLELDNRAQFAHLMDLPAVQAAERFAHVHDAAAADRDDNVRREASGLLIDFKQLLDRRVGFAEAARLHVPALFRVGQRRDRGQVEHRHIPCQHQHTLMRQVHFGQHVFQFGNAARPLDRAHRIIVTVHFAASPCSMRRLICPIACGSSRMESITRSAPACR